MAPLELPRLDFLSDEEWARYFSIADDNECFAPTAAKPLPICDHWHRLLDQVGRNEVGGHISELRHFGTTFSRVDYASIYACEHPLGPVLRGVLETLQQKSLVGLDVTCIVARGLAVVMAKRLERWHVLWAKVFAWVVECVNNSMKDPAWMVGMEFLAQLHREVNYDLGGEFPEVVAKLGNLGNRERLPLGFWYCLETATRGPRLHLNIHPSNPCEIQPRCVVSGLLQHDNLERLLGYLDYESIVNLRATCQLVRQKVDDLLEESSFLRHNIRANRKADLWLRARPSIGEIEVEDDPGTNQKWMLEAALTGDRVYSVVGHAKGLATADISSPLANPVLYRPNEKHLWTLFDHMAFQHIRRWDGELNDSGYRWNGLNWARTSEAKVKGAVFRARYVERTNESPGKYEVNVDKDVLRSYVGDRWSLKIKASLSKETVFVLFRGKKENCLMSQYLLEIFNAQERTVVGSVEFDTVYRLDDQSLQCATDDFIITQLEEDGVNFLKAFARVNNQWVRIGEKYLISAYIMTLWTGDGLVAWKEAQANHDSSDDSVEDTDPIINILDVRPARLARVYRSGENVFELAKRIYFPGSYIIRAFKRGFFGYQYIKHRRVVKLKIMNLEEIGSVGEDRIEASEDVVDSESLNIDGDAPNDTDCEQESLVEAPTVQSTSGVRAKNFFHFIPAFLCFAIAFFIYEYTI